MPFTFAHPAIVLPLNQLPKRLVSLTALVIGSMVPDFEYFIRLKVTGIYGHTLPGLLYFNLPLGLLIFFVYQHIVKNVLIDHLPNYLNHKFTDYKTPGNHVLRMNILLIIPCLLIGSASHIFWDSFTHKDGFFVHHLEVLTSTISFAGHPVFVYKLLQHASTLTGFFVIGYAIVQLPKEEVLARRGIAGFWLAVFAVMLMLLFIKVLACYNRWKTQPELPYGDIIVTGIAGAMLGLLLVCTTPQQKRPHSWGLLNINL